MADFNSFHQGTNDLAPRRPIAFLQPVTHSLGKFFELADHQTEFAFGGSLVGDCLHVGFELLKSPFGVAQSGFKLLLRQQAVFVGVD